MKFIFLVVLTLIFIKIQAGSKIVSPVIRNIISLEENNNDTLMLKGKIEKKEFVDKAGRVHADIYDLFFKTADVTYFIKINESKISKQELENHLNANLELQVIIQDGAWDTNPDGSSEVQSRTGKYIVVVEIESHNHK